MSPTFLMLKLLDSAMFCYLCAAPASHLHPLKDGFTAHSYARVPNAWEFGKKGEYRYHLCERCHKFMVGDTVQCWYFNRDRENPNGSKGAYTKLFARSFSWLWQGDTLLCPTIGAPEEHIAVSASARVGRPETFAVVTNLPTRAQMREWLLKPPEPPFTIAINQNGQKHVLYRAQAAQSQTFFPVVFEEDVLYIDRCQFTAIVDVYESLLGLGFSKTELDSGEYRSNLLRQHMAAWSPLEQQLAIHRPGGKPTRLLQLVNHIAQKP